MKRFALCLFGCYCGIAQAADSDITFHGTLVSPPACAISDGKPLKLSFVTSLSTTSTAITSARMCPIPLHAIPTCATMHGR